MMHSIHVYLHTFTVNKFAPLLASTFYVCMCVCMWRWRCGCVFVYLLLFIIMCCAAFSIKCALDENNCKVGPHK